MIRSLSDHVSINHRRYQRLTQKETSRNVAGAIVKQGKFQG
jgi:hypothetical protein